MSISMKVQSCIEGASWIRKMFEEVGHHVEKIRRVRYGPLELDVPPGEFRPLTLMEISKLRAAVDRTPAQRATAQRSPAQRTPAQRATAKRTPAKRTSPRRRRA